MNRRLLVLVLVLGALIGLHAWDAVVEPTDVVAAVPPRAAPHDGPGTDAEPAMLRQAISAFPSASSPVSGVEALQRLRPILETPKGDPFTVARSEPVVPAPRAAPPPPPVVAVVVPPPPPVVFTMTAMGRWEDAEGAALFMSDGRTTIKVQVGDPLPGGFELTRIEEGSFEVRHLASGQTMSRSIGGTGSAATAPSLPAQHVGAAPQ